MTARTVLAGNRVTVTWPITLESGALTDLDVTVLVVDPRTGIIVDEVTPTVTADDTDTSKGTIAVEVTIADDTTADRLIVRLDGDDTLGDVLAAEVALVVLPAAAQRP